MKYLIYFSLMWNLMLTFTVVLLDQYYDEATVQIAKHIVISHTTMHERFKNHEHE